MNFKSMLLAVMTLFAGYQLNAQCQKTAEVKNISHDNSPDIVEIASSLDDFSTLVAAVSAADLVETLQGTGPFTVFAPTNEAFNNLPKGTVETLLKPENKEQLQKVLTYHVIAGELMAKDVIAAIDSNGGKATVTTVSGDQLTAMVKNGKVMLKDENGNMSEVIKTDVDASNGVIHVIDTVVLPK